MIRHIVFDMGQVLVNFNIGLFTDRLRLSEADAALIRREVLTTVEWVRMDRGTISDDDALARMQARLPRHLHGTAEYLVRRWNDPIVPVEGMADVARDLKNAGYDPPAHLLARHSRQRVLQRYVHLRGPPPAEAGGRHLSGVFPEVRSEAGGLPVHRRFPRQH